MGILPTAVAAAVGAQRGRKAKNGVLRETGLENRSRPENRWIRLEIALRAFFSKCRNPKIPKASNKCAKNVRKTKQIKNKKRNGSGKVLPGSRQVRVDQNCAPNPMECLPEPKTPKKKKTKMPRTPPHSYPHVGVYYTCIIPGRRIDLTFRSFFQRPVPCIISL